MSSEEKDKIPISEIASSMETKSTTKILTMSNVIKLIVILLTAIITYFLTKNTTITVSGTTGAIGLVVLATYYGW